MKEIEIRFPFPDLKVGDNWDNFLDIFFYTLHASFAVEVLWMKK